MQTHSWIFQTAFLTIHKTKPGGKWNSLGVTLRLREVSLTFPEVRWMTKSSEHQTKNLALCDQHSLLKMGGPGTCPWSLKKPAWELGSSFHSASLLLPCPVPPGTILLLPPALNLSSPRSPSNSDWTTAKYKWGCNRVALVKWIPHAVSSSKSPKNTLTLLYQLVFGSVSLLQICLEAEVTL